MSDPRADRTTYLERVAAGLRLPPSSQADVLEELDSHIAESVAGLQGEGLSPDAAERETLARLGDPGELAEGIRRARQTGRRLLLATGYGVWAAIGGALWGYLFAFGIVLLSASLSATVLSFLLQQMHIETAGWEAPSALLTIPYAAFAAAYAGRRVPAAVSRHADRPVGAVARPVALVGGVVLTLLAVFVIRAALDPATIVVLLLLPIGFVAGALTAPDRDEAVGRVRIRARWVVALVILSSLALTVAGAATLRGSIGAGAVDDPGLARVGPIVAEGLGTTMYGSSGSWSAGVASLDFIADPPTAFVGWRDLRLEAWPAVDASGLLRGDATSPAVTAPMAGSDGHWSSRIELPVTKARTWFAVLTTGVAPDGRRYVLAGAYGPIEGRPWVGSVWEWFTTP